MDIRIKCESCKKVFMIASVHIVAGAALCPHCKAANRLVCWGEAIVVKIIRTRLLEKLAGTWVYCTRCLKTVFMAHNIPVCPECSSRGIESVVAGYAMPLGFVERFLKDNKLVKVAFVSDGSFRRYIVAMPSSDYKEIEERHKGMDI